jgi:micrococcal nuclease
MARVATWVMLLGLMAGGRAAAQTVTAVPSVDVLEVQGIGKVHLVGIAPAERRVELGASGPPAPPQTRPENPPPSIVGGRINLRPDRAGRDFLRSLVLGKDVVLQYEDPAEEKGRPRVYVHLGDGTSVNEELLRQGRARVDTSVPFAKREAYEEIERAAKAERRGVWAEPSSPR